LRINLHPLTVGHRSQVSLLCEFRWWCRKPES
jgi:hypothetical protein